MSLPRCFSCMAELSSSEGRCPNCGKNNAATAKAQPKHALPCGTRLAQRYVIGRVLGQGGFGITYIGWDTIMEARVCIKEYFPDGAAMRDSSRSHKVYWGNTAIAQTQKAGRESLINEARRAGKLRDLNSVVKVWDVFYTNDTAYIVMEFIEGKSLREEMAQRGRPLQEAECLELFRAVMEDLSKAHARGIIHRDISPDNLMLQSDGSLVLLDMGAAKDLNSRQRSTSLLVAKMGFSPIEQYSKNGQIGPWTDVYALCTTMVFCLNSCIQPNPVERLSGQPLRLDGISPQVRAVLENGMSIWPAERIKTMDELLARLTAAVEALPEEKPDGKKKRSFRAMPRRTLAWALAAAVLVCGLTVFLVRLPSIRRQRDAAAALPSPTPAQETAPSLEEGTQEEPGQTPVEVPAQNERPEAPEQESQTSAGLSYVVGEDSVRITGCDTTLSLVIIPATIENMPVTEIGAAAFDRCYSIRSVLIPESVTKIDSSAFINCTGLISISIPDSVVSIGSTTFLNCPNLGSIEVNEGNPQYVSVDGVLYTKDMTKLICCPGGIAKNSFSVPDGVTEIDGYAFAHCATLRSITLPDSVSEIGYSAFSPCDSLRHIDVSSANACFRTIDGVLYTRDAEKLICCPGGIGENAFTIPSGVTSIGGAAFSSCDAVNSVTIPASMSSINAWAFSNCTNLRRLEVNVNNTQYCSIDGVLFSKDGKQILYYPEGRADDSFAIPEGVTEVGDNAFSHSRSLKTVTIPQGVTGIGNSAFLNCSSLSSVTIPASVKSVGSSAFAYCTALKEINYGGTREQWEAITFGDYGNDNITEMTIHFNAAE